MRSVLFHCHQGKYENGNLGDISVVDSTGRAVDCSVFRKQLLLTRMTQRLGWVLLLLHRMFFDAAFSLGGVMTRRAD